MAVVPSGRNKGGKDEEVKLVEMFLARYQKSRGESVWQTEEQAWHDSEEKYKVHEIQEMEGSSTFCGQLLYHV
ncbi:hypothetical protein E2C01_066266 [Portunus trituberculatus]|uniref:Uncharacterized protein n=1 Tax=Portunus trituberculatus TaxID=210409 RepID=A0A5B7HU78_PORTR|nr:hypothetical protein [Portunus trituberculatus]